jgi:multiple sugar transport system substrate-binding protein
MEVLADYTDKWAEWDEREGIIQQGIDGLTFDGKIYSGMPETLNVRSFQYHASLFEEAGVTAVPETWDDLITVGQALTESGVPGFGFCGTSARMPQELIVFLWQNDLDIAVDTGDLVFRNTWLDNHAWNRAPRGDRLGLSRAGHTVSPGVYRQLAERPLDEKLYRK